MDTGLNDGISFYEKAFNARELRHWSNDDGSVHVAEMMIGDALFHLHEEVSRENELSPKILGGTCVILGLFVADPDEVVAGAIETTPVKDYDYGYRKGEILQIHSAITGRLKKEFKNGLEIE